jgi:hypothetical protein
MVLNFCSSTECIVRLDVPESELYLSGWRWATWRQ